MSTLRSGFLLGIFSRGKSIVMQISFVMLLFSDQILGRGKSFQGGKLPQGGAPYLSLWKKARGSGLEFDIKYHILHDFRTSNPFNEKQSQYFKDLYRLTLLTNLDVNLTLSSEGDTTFNTLFITPPRNEVGLTSKFLRNFSLWRSLKWSEAVSLNGVEVPKCDTSCQTLVPAITNNNLYNYYPYPPSTRQGLAGSGIQLKWAGCKS